MKRDLAHKEASSYTALTCFPGLPVFVDPTSQTLINAKVTMSHVFVVFPLMNDDDPEHQEHLAQSWKLEAEPRDIPSEQPFLAQRVIVSR